MWRVWSSIPPLRTRLGATSSFYILVVQLRSMSDAVDDLDFWGRQVLKKSQVNPLREKMQDFVSKAEQADLKEIRRNTSGGSELSGIVQEDREERI